MTYYLKSNKSVKSYKENLNKNKLNKIITGYQTNMTEKIYQDE